MTNKLHPDFLKPFDPTSNEAVVQKLWNESGFTNPDVLVEKGVADENAETFTIIQPPPNVTGVLHMGHVLGLTVQDLAIRYNRMLGKKTLWIPGTDHAAIATQSKVEKEIQKKEGKNRYDLGREEMLKRVKEFAQNSHDTIVSQVKRFGASVDWSRECFTLDEQRNLAVNTVFKKMYDAGLIYQGERIVNWDPKGQTTISDDELVYVEEKTTFYTFKYGPFEIGTARPETKFGDKYIVVHPDDARYAQYENGQKFELEWINGPITATLIKDPVIDPEFGTGAMTITPWHSQVDFDLAEKYKLDKEQIIDKYGKLLPIAGEFAGMKIKDARAKIVEKMREKGLVLKEEEYTHNIATAERTDMVVEPQIMKQWFVNVTKKFVLPHSEIEGIPSGSETTLKEIMIKAVSNKQVSFIPERFENTYFHWIENLRDWCISRQIWYGHRIPVWYKGDEIYCDATAPTGEGWIQDEDTLDTWFSSGLWSFSTMGWPEITSDFKTYHPTNLLVTAYEIIFFWVARMILMTGFTLGTIPFSKTYITGLVRAKDGKKLSKSLGNSPDPILTADEFGVDAIRMSMLMGLAAGTDMKLDVDKIRGFRNFSNKLWNIARFVITNTAGLSTNSGTEEKPVVEPVETTFEYKGLAGITEEADLQLVSEFNQVAKEVTTEIENEQYHIASEKLYHFAWTRFASEILEDSKNNMTESRKNTLVYLLVSTLKLLHPFTPHTTESIWQRLPDSFKKDDRDILMVCNWPTSPQR